MRCAGERNTGGERRFHWLGVSNSVQKETRKNTDSVGCRNRQAALYDEDPGRLLVKPGAKVEWIRSPDVVRGGTPADSGDWEMLKVYFLRLCLHPGGCIPVRANVASGRFGVRCNREKLHFDGPARRNEHGRDDNVVEGRFAASTVGVGLGDG